MFLSNFCTAASNFGTILLCSEVINPILSDNSSYLRDLFV